MKKTVIPIAVLLSLLLLGSTGLAAGPERLWWTEFTSDVFTWSGEGTYTYMFIEESTGTSMSNMVVVGNTEPYPGTVLIRPQSMQIRTDEPGLNCVDVAPLYTHMDQPVRFHIDWLADEPMSYEDADDSFDSLSFIVFSDDMVQYKMQLERQGTHPYHEGIDWSRAFCPWTIRP